MASPQGPVAPAPTQPKGAPEASVDPMAVLAREWAAMNRDVDDKPSKPSSNSTPVPIQPKTAHVPFPEDSSPPLKDLAQDWMARAMAADEATEAALPAVESPPPSSPAPVSPTPSTSSSTTIDQLALQWAAMNREVDSVSSPSSVVQSPPPTPVAPPAPPRTMENDWDRLAKEWMRMNSDI